MSTVYPSAKTPKEHARTYVVAIIGCVVIVAIAAVAGFALGRHSTSQVTPSAPSHAVTPAKPAGSSVPSGATAAIDRYETENGPGAGKWVIASSQVAKVNPKYVFFTIGPAKGFENSVQGGYGFALDSGALWKVIGFGSAMVGCPTSGSHDTVVPAAVLKEFGFACPPN
jgi:hypothetical protein